MYLSTRRRKRSDSLPSLEEYISSKRRRMHDDEHGRRERTGSIPTRMEWLRGKRRRIRDCSHGCGHHDLEHSHYRNRKDRYGEGRCDIRDHKRRDRDSRDRSDSGSFSRRRSRDDSHGHHRQYKRRKHRHELRTDSTTSTRVSVVPEAQSCLAAAHCSQSGPALFAMCW